MPPVPLHIRNRMRGSRHRDDDVKTKTLINTDQNEPETRDHHVKSMAHDEKYIHEHIAQSWIIYHMAGALAERNRRHNDKFAIETLRKISLDLHHYVLTACKTCSDHHIAYLDKHPVNGALLLKGGFEEWVFDLHNAVNQRAGKVVLSKEEHLPRVVAHYREALECVGKGGTTGLLSRALPILTTRFCYGCQ